MSRAYSFTLIFLLSAVFFSGAMELVGFTSVTASTPIISVDPSTSRAEVGQTFMINITISDVIDLYGWEFKLRWNSTLLEVLNITEGTFLKGVGNTFFVSKINNTLGYMLVDCSLVGDVSGVSGNGTLATAEFSAEAQGECILELYSTKLVSSLEQSIIHAAIDGTVKTIKHPLAYFSYSPPSPGIGEIVTFDASASNPDGGNITSYKWDFDDGNVTTVSDPIITHVYPSEGILNVTLTITDSEGLTDSTWQLIGIGVILLHDVATTNVISAKTVVGQGCSMNINVTVENQGEAPETFNITAYANETIIDTREITLTSGSSTIMTFTWNTTHCQEYQNYTISAYAHQVAGETDTDDNTFINSLVLVVHMGDVNIDGKVRVDDILAVALKFGSNLGDPDWDPNCDINCDNKVRVDDILVAALNFGWTKS